MIHLEFCMTKTSIKKGHHQGRPLRGRSAGFLVRMIASTLSVLISQTSGYAQPSPARQESPSEQSDQSATGVIPAPPPLIAPQGLLSEQVLMLPQDQLQEYEGQFKSEADGAYAKGDYQRALIALQRAYLVSKKPRYIANQGLVLEKMRRYQDAISALEYFLLTQPAQDKARSAQQVINRLRPEVKIISDPQGALIFIDGESKSQGVTPLTMRLIAGEHPMKLTLRGYEELNTTLFVLPGKPVLAQYKLDQSSSAFVQPEATQKEADAQPMSRGQLSVIVLGGVSLGISATSFWLTRGAIIERDAAISSERWRIAQSEAELLSDLTLGAASLGLTSVATGLAWWLLSSPESPASAPSAIVPPSSPLIPQSSTRALP